VEKVECGLLDWHFTDEKGRRRHYKTLKTYLVGYDLNKPRENNDYTDLVEKIKSLTNGFWHCLDSTWIIGSSQSAAQIRDVLNPYFDSGDELLVVHLSGEAAWTGLDNSCFSWLKANLS
jgi:hypothetical protein